MNIPYYSSYSFLFDIPLSAFIFGLIGYLMVLQIFRFHHMGRIYGVKYIGSKSFNNSMMVFLLLLELLYLDFDR
jgi:hypothetical protein